MAALFRFDTPAWELIVRGTMIYWFLFLLFRFVLRRDPGSNGLADILLVVLISDATQNGMAGEYKSIAEGMVLIGTIAAWNVWIDWMSFRFPWFIKFAEARMIPLIRHGRILRANLQRQMITEEDLKRQLRLQGVEDPQRVKHAALESDGSVSVVPYGS